MLNRKVLFLISLSALTLVLLILPSGIYSPKTQNIITVDETGWHSIPDFGGVTPNIYQYDFINAQVGWAVGRYGNVGKVYQTTNGGINWTDKFTTNFSTQLTAVDFINSTTGIVAGISKIYKTNDTGITLRLPIFMGMS
jgi:hypothetical protein